MRTDEIMVANVSCGSCARAIKNGLSPVKEISTVDVNVEKGMVTVVWEGNDRNTLTTLLEELGYPEIEKN